MVRRSIFPTAVISFIAAEEDNDNDDRNTHSSRNPGRVRQEADLEHVPSLGFHRLWLLESKDKSSFTIFPLVPF